MTPPVAVGVLVLLLLNGQNGLLNHVLEFVGIDGPNWTTDPAWVKPGLALMSLWTVGASVIILLASMNNVPNDLYDAAQLDGAGAWSSFWYVTLPGISGAVYFIVIVDTIAGLSRSRRPTRLSSARATRRTATTPRSSARSTSSSRRSSSSRWAARRPWPCCSSS